MDGHKSDVASNLFVYPRIGVRYLTATHPPDTPYVVHVSLLRLHIRLFKARSPT